jgi:hypothetical protein
MIEDIAVNDEDRQVLRLLTLGPTLGRPFAAPPGVPMERITALRAAFAATARDPELLAEAANAGMELEPLGGEAIQGAGRECAKDAEDDRRTGEGLSAIAITGG